MAVTLVGSNGIFTRLGKIMYVIKKIQVLQFASPNGLKDEIEDVIDEYSGADAFMMAGLPGQLLNIQINAGNAITGALRSAASKTVIEMVNADTNKLPDRSLKTAMVELIDQMLNTTDDVTGGETITSTAAAKAANTGNGTILTSITKPTSPDAGDQWTNCRAERIEVQWCNRWSGFRVRGQPWTEGHRSDRELPEVCRPQHAPQLCVRDFHGHQYAGQLDPEHRCGWH